MHIHDSLQFAEDNKTISTVDDNGFENCASTFIQKSKFWAEDELVQDVQDKGEASKIGNPSMMITNNIYSIK